MVGGRLIGRGRRLALGMADGLVTMPLLRWTWRGQIDHAFAGDLPDFRPSDQDAVRDMMSGRYLLASKLFETQGASPFSLEVDHADWWNNLHSFSWLRHFRDVRDPGEKYFARTLVLDWISREGQFEHDSWTLSLTAQRVLNWLRHLTLVLDGATPEQARPPSSAAWAHRCKAFGCAPISLPTRLRPCLPPSAWSAPSSAMPPTCPMWSLRWDGSMRFWQASSMSMVSISPAIRNCSCSC
ncbi:hypothetical protein [Devosia aurantiaca]|uniref:Heparinase II/III-like protein n=1 Tax=Devosia aurantiaca TaxID=2714858 RepID=A0A6M1S9L4_9HYPH|nr:hypothetical protein [Devosia aurantiaca]NGP16699.1 hypothetical protein [Devosia aurantiaca]